MKLGIDIGSTTIKLTLVDDIGKIVFSEYQRHLSNIQETLEELFLKAKEKFGSASFSAQITGSGGLSISQWLGIPFIQEVVAVSHAIEVFAPKTDVAIEIGGEDAKIVYFAGGIEQRMNGICAGGTGSFIDQMAALLQTDASGLNDLAKKHTTIYPIAARCGVFAKSDIQPLINEGAAREDLAVSVFHAVVTQTISGLAQGKPIRGNVAFLGGPLHFLSELRERFIKSLNLQPENIIVPDNSHLFAALGAAHTAKGEELTFENILHNLKNNKKIVHEIARLESLFKDSRELDEFLDRHSGAIVPKQELSTYKGDIYIGIDAGSTTTKLALISEKGELLHSFYAGNQGSPLKVIITALKEIYSILPKGTNIASSCVTGYGEYLAKAALNVDHGEIETVAHYKAAAFFEPQVDFILDIGGQDMKCLHIKDGVIDNVSLNEACSAGCGSFIETFAVSLSMSVQDFSNIALFAKEPIDLGSRCTVFMNSRVKQAQKEGAQVGDISAGLSYAVIKNSLQKVIKAPDPKTLGKKIVVQGGTFYNNAVLRTFEKITDCEVIRPDIAGLMGAFGAALIARERAVAGTTSSLLSLQELENLQMQSTMARCGLCENNCLLTINKFSGGKRFISGNRCDRPLGKNATDTTEKGFNFFEYKYNRVFGYTSLSPEQATRGTVGIPRVLNIYENYPFWHTFFTKLNYRVVLSAPSSRDIYEKGVESMPSESVCYPAKLAHGHIADLIEKKVDFIFYPSVYFEQKEYDDADDCYNCPIVTSYPEAIRTNVEEIQELGLDYRNPFLNFNSPESMLEQLYEEFPDLPKNEIKEAFDLSWAEVDNLKREIRQKGEELYREIEAGDKYAVVLAGRPYHIDPEIHHGIPDMITGYGVTVLTEDCVSHLANARENGPLNVQDQWVYHSRLYAAAVVVTKSKNLELVQLNSFGCGLDAVAADETKEILESADKIYTCIKIDEVNNLGSARIRVRSLFAALEERKNQNFVPKKPQKRKGRVIFTKEMKKNHTMLCPQMAPIHFGLLQEAFRTVGYNVVMMPPIDKDAIDIGLRYVNNDACYPAIIVVGQLFKALKSGEYDINNTSVMMSQTGGGCRASNYVGYIRRALKQAGMSQVPVISISTQGIEKNPGFKFTPKFAIRVVKSLVYGDLLMRVLYATRPYEATIGSANALYDYWYDICKEDIFHGQKARFQKDPSRGPVKRGFKQICNHIVEDFDRLPLNNVKKPKVGVVGEILVKYHPTANNDLVTLLENEGVEVVVPDLIDFLLYGLFNTNFRHRHLGGKTSTKFFSNITINALEFCRRHAATALMFSKRFSAPHKIEHLAHIAEPVVSLGNQTGEGWFLTAEMIDMLEKGINNIICTQPFACLPNHVVGKGMMKELKRRYSAANIVAVDYDPGASEVNQVNRIKLMLAGAEKELLRSAV
ncbi:MAG: 2-hydroxyacyl-CoA dehydratase [Defluviitaleaceae bacterium]|nr:2-hydroxyacyl-CoA dehydratase [Defluviitaleaceae bacterium]